MLASGCAVARAFPKYNRKSGGSKVQKVTVGFIPVGDDVSEVNNDDIKCLRALSEGIRLAQEIVDAPTNEMHTDAFIEVSQFLSLSLLPLSLSLSPSPLSLLTDSSVVNLPSMSLHVCIHRKFVKLANRLVLSQWLFRERSWTRKALEVPWQHLFCILAFNFV